MRNYCRCKPNRGKGRRAGAPWPLAVAGHLATTDAVGENIFLDSLVKGKKESLDFFSKLKNHRLSLSKSSAAVGHAAPQGIIVLAHGFDKPIKNDRMI